MPLIGGKGAEKVSFKWSNQTHTKSRVFIKGKKKWLHFLKEWLSNEKSPISSPPSHWIIRLLLLSCLSWDIWKASYDFIWRAWTFLCAQGIYVVPFGSWQMPFFSYLKTKQKRVFSLHDGCVLSLPNSFWFSAGVIMYSRSLWKIHFHQQFIYFTVGSPRILKRNSAEGGGVQNECFCPSMAGDGGWQGQMLAEAQKSVKGTPSWGLCRLGWKIYSPFLTE